MRITLSETESRLLRAKLDAFEDAEATAPNEYVVDLFDNTPPLSLELEFAKDGLCVLASEKLAYNEELDGWYMAEPFDDAVALEATLRDLANA